MTPEKVAVPLTAAMLLLVRVPLPAVVEQSDEVYALSTIVSVLETRLP